MSDHEPIDAAVPAGRRQSPRRPVRRDQTPTCGDWIALLKPRVMSLVVFSGLIGLLVAPGHLHPVLAFTAVLCIAVAAGACGAINMWYDRDIDAIMRRTRGGRSRPAASSRTPRSAMASPSRSARCW